MGRVVHESGGTMFAQYELNAVHELESDTGTNSERVFAKLVQGITDYAIYMLHPDGTVANWNAGAERFKQYTAAEIVGLHYRRFYSSQDQAAGIPERNLQIALERGRFEDEGLRYRKDGSSFWAHVIIDPIFEDDGSLLGFAKITRDKSEQRELEMSRRLAERRFRLLVDGITDHAIYMIDPEGIVVNWNSGAERVKGYKAQEIVGQSFACFYSIDEQKTGAPARCLEIALQEGRFEEEGVRLRKNGSSFWAHVVIHPIYEEDGSLIGFAKITRDRTEYNQNAERIAYMACHDALTDLPNRRQFVDNLDVALKRSDAKGNKVALINIDLDGFKAINDTHGHAVGDTVLRALSARMSAGLRAGEMVARFGGDEFVAYKVHHSPAQLTDFIERLKLALTQPVRLPHSDLTPGASFGIAVWPDDANDRDKLINNADLAMYRAKGSVETGVCYYEAEMDERARRRRALASDLWTGLSEKQFVLHYQAQHSVSSGEITGYEALVRWNHPMLGMLAPADFIPIAEECGAIVPLGEWVLDQACADAVEYELCKVAVNLSPLQLNNVSIVNKVHDVLIKSGLSPHRLELEVTETAVIADRERALHILRQFKNMGIRIAMDDFGTGHSSLETLRSFPFDRIKLDRSFTSALGKDRQSNAFVRAMLALGSSLDISVLAEGVETASQMDFLTAEGCSEVQGFMFSRPSLLVHGQGASRKHGTL